MCHLFTNQPQFHYHYRGASPTLVAAKEFFLERTDRGLKLTPVYVQRRKYDVRKLGDGTIAVLAPVEEQGAVAEIKMIDGRRVRVPMTVKAGMHCSPLLIFEPRVGDFLIFSRNAPDPKDIETMDYFTVNMLVEIEPAYLTAVDRSDVSASRIFLPPPRRVNTIIGEIIEELRVQVSKVSTNYKKATQSLGRYIKMWPTLYEMILHEYVVEPTSEEV